MITFQKESIADIWDEAIENAKLHWEETEGYRHNQNFQPDKARFIQYEKLGMFHTFTARDDGKLIGNVTMYVSESMHTGIKIATEDTMFIRKEYRGSRVYYRLFKMAEQAMIDMGVEEIVLTSKLTNNAGALIERMGYTHIANQYSKSFIGADSADKLTGT